jgi:phosphoglycerate kinase
MFFQTLDDVNVSGKRVLLRLDLNVPMQNGKITDASRIDECLETIRELQLKKAKIIILSHFGRPNGKPEMEYSLRPVAAALKDTLNLPIFFSDQVVGDRTKALVDSLKPGEIAMLENVRFEPGEEKNERAFAVQLARLASVYVNDAFSASHRAHASIVGVTEFLPSYGGRLMVREISSLEKCLEKPKRPMMAIVGGAKISSKLGLIMKLASKVDSIAIVGGMANTFLLAQGFKMGKSLVEPGMVGQALDTIKFMEKRGCAYILPTDVAVVMPKGCSNQKVRIVDVGHINEQEMALDVGPKTVEAIRNQIEKSQTLTWNGSLGVNEIPPFDKGTRAIAEYVAERTQQGKLVSIAGGGDTVGALHQAGVADKLSYVSLAGGAFLEWLEGVYLPGIVALDKAARMQEV